MTTTKASAVPAARPHMKVLKVLFVVNKLVCANSNAKKRTEFLGIEKSSKAVYPL